MALVSQEFVFSMAKSEAHAHTTTVILRLRDAFLHIHACILAPLCASAISCAPLIRACILHSPRRKEGAKTSRLLALRQRCLIYASLGFLHSHNAKRLLKRFQVKRHCFNPRLRAIANDEEAFFPLNE